ncbi:MAG: InlB B-repeat-containing protein, partial [Lachnospiraceae bacterium]|nr:InlB B-repeat-containing protein [Lachnospiraceae bacterium]
DYLPNISGYTGQCPVSKQYKKGTEVTVDGQNTLQSQGYVFAGWNTKADGSGYGYQKGSKITLKEDTKLYAQWIPSNETPYTLLCYNTETEQEISNARKVRYGTTGNTIKANDEDKTLPGYTFDDGNSKNVVRSQIKADGTTTLILWFNPGHAVSVKAAQTSKIYDGEEISDIVASVKVDGEDVPYTIGSDGISFTFKNKDYKIPGVVPTMKKGDETVTAAKDVGNYTISMGSGSKIQQNGKDTAFTLDVENGYINIAPRSVAIASKSGTWEYDGKAHTLEETEVTGDGWAKGDSLPKLKFTGSQKAPGTSQNTFGMLADNGGIDETSWQAKFPNYSITITYGTLTVSGRATKFEVKVKPDSFTSPYNGSEQNVDKDAFSVNEQSGGSASGIGKLADAIKKSETKTFTMSGETYTLEGLSASGGGTDAGEYSITLSGTETIKDESGADVTDQFHVDKQTGTLTITKLDAKIESKSLSKVYDGSKLVNGDTEVIQTGFINGEGAENFNFTGEAEDPGEVVPNAFSYSLKSNTKAENYNIQEVVGTLTITSNGAAYEVTVTPKSKTDLKYDGEEKSVSGFVGETEKGVPVTANGHTYYVTGLTAGASSAVAGTTPVTVSGKAVVKNEKGKDLSSEFNVKIGTGTLVIAKRDITLTSASLSKPYDGRALVNPEGSLEVKETGDIRVDKQGGITGDGLVGDDTITLSFKG